MVFFMGRSRKRRDRGNPTHNRVFAECWRTRGSSTDMEAVLQTSMVGRHWIALWFVYRKRLACRGRLTVRGEHEARMSGVFDIVRQDRTASGQGARISEDVEGISL